MIAHSVASQSVSSAGQLGTPASIPLLQARRQIAAALQDGKQKLQKQQPEDALALFKQVVSSGNQHAALQPLLLCAKLRFAAVQTGK